MKNRKSKKKGGNNDCFNVNVDYNKPCNNLPLDNLYLNYKKGGKKKSLRKKKYI